MYYSRHPTEYQMSERTKNNLQDDRSTYYGGQSFREINLNDQSAYRRSGYVPPNLQNTNMYYSQSNMPNFVRQPHTYNQASNIYESKRLNEQPMSRVRVNQPSRYTGQTHGIPIYQSHHYIHHQPHFVTQQPSHVPYEREFISVRPILTSELRQAVQSNVRLQPMESHVQNPNDFKIFCPACHQQYYNSQVEQHIERHYLYNTDQFKIGNSAEMTEDSYQQSLPLTIQSRSYYPLIEPQQFQTSQLDQVNYLNKYKVQTEDKNKKQSDITVRSAGTQFARPPLQQRSDQTDFYNCFDNIFNDRNTFSIKDVTTSNSVLAKKRELEDWQKIRSQKQGYKIKNK